MCDVRRRWRLEGEVLGGGGGGWLEMGVVEGSLTPLLYFILLCFTYHFSILFYFTFLLHSALLCSTLHIINQRGRESGLWETFLCVLFKWGRC